MKKALSIVAIAAALALSLTACGGIKDGTYVAENKNEANGWRDTVTVTYKGGTVVDAKYDALKDDGTLKSSLTDEQYTMTNPALSEWLPKLNENLIKANGDPEKVEAVAGATGSSTAAKELMKAVAANAKAGKTETALVDNVVAAE